MKLILFFSLILLCNSQSIAQNGSPKVIGILMIGKTGKPILPMYIVDSTRKMEFSHEERAYIYYSNSNVQNKTFALFSKEPTWDTTKIENYEFGTFLFEFHFDNEIRVVKGSRVQSAVFFQKLICALSENKDEAEILKALNERLFRINY